MMKLIKKIFNIFLILIVITSIIFPGIKVNAKTLGDLKTELDNLELKAKTTKDKINYTEAEITSIRRAIRQIYIDMENIEKEIIDKNIEIENFHLEIKEKQKETAELMKFIQISGGDMVYLEYIMGAQSLTDFIYRISIAEQLSKYNSDLIDKMNGMIKANENRKVELKQKEIALANKQVDLGKKLNSLSYQKESLHEYERSIEEEIKIARQVIKMYQDAGCKLEEDINVCANRLLPPDTRFWRPMTQGYVTSEYGYRIHPITKKADIHAAIDVSNSDKIGTKVYSVANGKVAKVFYDIYGGNQVVVHHNILSGSTSKSYSSTYVHLGSVSVKDGQVVTKDTVIGMMSNTGIYTTGAHLHLAISNGHRYKDYVSYSDYIAKSFNPRTVINFPAKGSYWYNRITKY